MKGPIEYLSWISGFYYSFNPDPDPKYLPLLTDISLTPAGADPYGMLKAGGTITLRGRVAVAFTKNQEYTVSKERHIGQFHDRQDLLNPVDKSVLGAVRYDIPLCADCAPTGEVNVVMLLFCMVDKTRDDSTPRTYGLVLQPITNVEEGVPGECRRVGVAWGIEPPFWEQSGRDMTVRLC